MSLSFLKSLFGKKPPEQPAPLPAPEPDFDPQWYLQAYPDVARAGVDPWQHYVRHGRAEGRQPCRNRAEIYDYHLWRGLDGIMLLKLQHLLNEEASEREADHARWALARWYLWQGQPEQAAALPDRLRERPLITPVHVGSGLVCLEALLVLRQIESARQVLTVMKQQHPGSADVVLAECNLLSRELPDTRLEERLRLLDDLWCHNGLQPVQVDIASSALPFDSLYSDSPRASGDGIETPLVSVIVPVYNAGAGLETALRSLRQQSWPNLEVVVVDDASSDGSVRLAARLSEEFSGPGRVFRVIHHAVNAGAYAARNTGMAEATGDYLTVQDADDWSHPQKLERQVFALRQDPPLKASVSHWVRADDELLFGRWRVEEGWVYRNVSSLMIRRAVFEQLGFWDEVRVNADTEYYHRIIAAWGRDSIGEVMPGVPLAFGRAGAETLSQASKTHLITQFGGVRKDYMDAAHRWHAAAVGVDELYLKRGERTFRAPGLILPRTLTDAHGQGQGRFVFPSVSVRERPWPDETAERHLKDWMQQSVWFDSTWYLRRYPDLQEVAVDAFDHWWSVGAAEGRDPGPGFSVSGYCWQQNLPGLSAAEMAKRLLHADDKHMSQPQVIAGECSDRPGRPWVMVCAHQAGPAMFGAERSLLDVLSAFQALDVNVLAVLPEARNQDYTDTVCRLSQRTGILPMAWWQQGAQASSVTRSWLETWLLEAGISRVYLNTVVHLEPALAAKACGIPVAVHARELPARDPSLCEVLNATPEQVRGHAVECADILVANSRYLADYYNAPETLVVPNTVNVDDFCVDLPPGSRLRVGLISSNLPKKGLDDFVALAAELQTRGVEVTCVLIGPDNSHTARLRNLRAARQLPANIEFAGYAETPRQALAQLHVVVNLSHFEESFGRTVLEAMAAARPVVCYAHGALPDLVQDGETGFLVPRGDVSAAADALERLAGNDLLRAGMGEAGQRRAAQGYSAGVMQARFRQWLETV